MSDRQNSLKPIDARTPYAPFTQPLRNAATYRWSVLNAPLVEGQRDINGVFQKQSFNPGTDSELYLALFTQDVPVFLQGSSSYPGGFFPEPDQTPIPPLDMVEPGVFLVSGFTQPDMATAGTVEAGEVSRVSLPLTSPVLTFPAYAALFAPRNRTLTTAEDIALRCNLSLSVIAESGVLSGTPTFDNAGAPGISDVEPILLPSFAYTAEIRRNRNIIPSVSGGPVYVVVGLYAVQN